ncbi:MAG TPA: hypothetical protein VF911_14680, partial [Thermoanaerobaculia bacterium]
NGRGSRCVMSTRSSPGNGQRVTVNRTGNGQPTTVTEPTTNKHQTTPPQSGDQFAQAAAEKHRIWPDDTTTSAEGT